MSALSVNDWLRHTQPHHVTLADLRNLEQGESLDVCIMKSEGWGNVIVEDNQPKNKATPLTYFKEQFCARIRCFTPHHGTQKLDYMSIDTERKPTTWFNESSDWHDKLLYIEIANMAFTQVEYRGIPEAKEKVGFAKRFAPDLVGMSFGQMPGKCRIGDGRGVMIRMDDMERMPQIYRPDKQRD